MKFVIIGVLVVFLIAFFVLVWKAARHWRWFQILPVCVTMILAIVFLIPTAGVLKSRSAWHQVKEKLELQAAQVKTENNQLRHGDSASGEGLGELSTRLAKLGIEAGRSWRGLRFAGGNSQSLTLASAVAAAAIPEVTEDDADAEPAAPLPLVPVGLVVYGFAETMNPETQTAVPTFYLGEFRVTASGPSQVTLAPTAPLEVAQKQGIDAGQAKQWSIYELLPLDGHSPFIAAGSSPSDDNVLGRVDDALVRKVMGNQVSEATLKSYLEDGRRANNDDPILSRWTKVEFLKNHKIQVDSEEQRGALDGGFFDGNGRAVDARLQRPDEGDKGFVSFRKGDQILVQEEAGQPLIDEGTVKLLDQYYLRPMNDYRFILRHIRLRISELANRAKKLQVEQTMLQEAIDKSNGMLVANTKIKLKLEQDLAQFKTEHRVMKEYTQEQADGLAKMKKEMSRLHKQNVALAARLSEIHRSIERGTQSFTMVSP